MARKSRKIEAASVIAPLETTFKTALYLRLSVMDLGRDDSESIANQEELLRGYIAEHPEHDVKGVFTDNGETGTNFDRPEWLNLMRACRDGKVNCIILKDLSRLGRNFIETGDYLERILPMMGVRLIAVNDRYDSNNLNNSERLVSNLKNLVNDIYAKDISRKVISAMHTKQKNGEFLGGFASHGYLLDPSNKKKIVVNPDTAPVVRRIFEMKADGMGNGTICQALNAEGIPCPLRYRYLKGMSKSEKYANTIWIISTIAVILRNPLYLGHMTQRKQRKSICEGIESRRTTPDEWIIVQNTHEPIVTQELFDRANAVFNERTNIYKEHRHKYPEAEKRRRELILYDIAFCADCGKALARRKASSGSRNPRWVYRCRKHDDYKACSLKFMQESDLYDAVFYAVRTQIQRYADAADVLERLNRDNGYKSRLARFDEEIEEIENELRRITSLRRAIYEDYVAKLLTASEYQYATEKYDAEMEVQQGKLKAFKAERKEYTKHTDQKDKWFATFNRFLKNKSLTREMVHDCVERVEISNVNYVEVTVKFRDELEALIMEVKA